ncbi:hypothetical protein [Thalassotalea euphylliae]|uniref:Uncharacterized protein n=1 Tax=Thalassotalea euphylliae TaxID=1655234 RepID=A0A3E0U0M3_9GAMM|nr:hypothetical protein [Thalassotalea euphylliae]REL30229.1 hypothetical protein DXX94_05640 [Thalassotalea euphylliae]
MSTLLNLLANRCRFHSSGNFSFKYDGNGIAHQITDESKSKALLTIVGKEYTFETYRDLPIPSRKEALLAAKHMKNIAPFAGRTFLTASNVGEGKTRVHFFVIKEDVAQSICEHSFTIVPESLLLFLALSKDSAITGIRGALGGRITYAELTKDGFKCDVTAINTDDSVAISYPPTSIEASIKQLTQQEYFKLLFSQLASLPSSVYKQIFNGVLFASLWSPSFVKLSSIALSVSLISYMTLASGYLVYKESSLEARVNEQQNSLNELFEQQRKLESLSAQLTSIDNNPLFSHLSAPLWLLTTQLVEKGADILLISSSESETTIRMKAKKSTDVIHFLANSPLLTNPEVTSPAVKTGGKELFAVKFQLVGK